MINLTNHRFNILQSAVQKALMVIVFQVALFSQQAVRTWPELLHSPKVDIWKYFQLCNPDSSVLCAGEGCSDPGLETAIRPAVNLSGLSLPFWTDKWKLRHSNYAHQNWVKTLHDLGAVKPCPRITHLGFPDLLQKTVEGTCCTFGWCKRALIALVTCMCVPLQHRSFILTSPLSLSVCAQNLSGRPAVWLRDMHVSLPFVCVCRYMNMWVCVWTPSCSSFIHTGVILCRKACIRFLDIVRAGAMNYLLVHVFVKSPFSVIFYLSVLFFSPFTTPRQDSWLIPTVTWH